MAILLEEHYNRFASQDEIDDDYTFVPWPDMGEYSAGYEDGKLVIRYPQHTDETCPWLDVVSKKSFKAQGSYVHVKPAFSQFIADNDAEFGIYSGDNAWKKCVYICRVDASTIKATAWDKNTQNQFALTMLTNVYNATNHAYWRFREDGGDLLIETAPDGTTWTLQSTVSNDIVGMDLDHVRINMCFGNWDAQAEQWTSFDDLNWPGQHLDWEETMAVATYRLKDFLGRTTSMRIEPTGATLADKVSNAEDVSALLAACTNLGLISGFITFPLDITPTEAAEGSNTDVGGKVKGISADDGKVVILRVPDPIADIVNETGGFVLDEEHLEALLDEFKADGKALISDGEIVSSWTRGELDNR